MTFFFSLLKKKKKKRLFEKFEFVVKNVNTKRLTHEIHFEINFTFESLNSWRKSIAYKYFWLTFEFHFSYHRFFENIYYQYYYLFMQIHVDIMRDICKHHSFCFYRFIQALTFQLSRIFARISKHNSICIKINHHLTNFFCNSKCLKLFDVILFWCL